MDDDIDTNNNTNEKNVLLCTFEKKLNLRLQYEQYFLLIYLILWVICSSITCQSQLQSKQVEDYIVLLKTNTVKNTKEEEDNNNEKSSSHLKNFNIVRNDISNLLLGGSYISHYFENCLYGFAIGQVDSTKLSTLTQHRFVESVHIDQFVTVNDKINKKVTSETGMLNIQPISQTVEANESTSTSILTSTGGQTGGWLPWGIRRTGAFRCFNNDQTETGGRINANGGGISATGCFNNGQTETGCFNNGQTETGCTINATGAVTASNHTNTMCKYNDVDIFIIDTGIDLQHPDLNVGLLGRVFVPNCTSLMDENGHGTHVAGIVAAKNTAYGCVGVCPGARVHPIRCMNAAGTGQFSWVIAGIEYLQTLRRQHPHLKMVANISLGSMTNTASYSVLDMAVSRAITSGITFVIAAGNSSSEAKFCSPAHVATAITVAAYDESDRLANFSNFGTNITLLAPGTNIISTYPGNRCAYLSGTSMASPFVAGAAALYLARKDPLARPATIKAALVLAASSSPVQENPILNVNGTHTINRSLWIPTLFV
jgi:hypothetical protein